MWYQIHNLASFQRLLFHQVWSQHIDTQILFMSNKVRKICLHMKAVYLPVSIIRNSCHLKRQTMHYYKSITNVYMQKRCWIYNLCLKRSLTLRTFKHWDVHIYTTTFNDFVNMNLDFVLVNWIGEHKRHNKIFHLNENLRQNSQGSYLM